MSFVKEELIQRLGSYHPPENPKPQKRASVLVPVVECGEELCLWLTLRSSRLQSHSGQVAFPGGKQDPEDTDALHAALRESQEEIGLAPTDVEVIGRLDQIISINNYLVTPYVGLVHPEFTPTINHDEIEAVFKVPLSFFMSSQFHRKQPGSQRKYQYYVHYFDYYDPETNRAYLIWGLTAMLIIHFIQVGFEFHPPYDVMPPGAPHWAELTQKFEGVRG